MIDWCTILAGVTQGKTLVKLADHDIIFRQGQPADSRVFPPRRQGPTRRGIP